MWNPIIITVVVVVLAGAVALFRSRTSKPSLERVPAIGPGVAEEGFAQEIAACFGTEPNTGNRLATLCNGDEIFPEMLEAVRGARESITFESYVFWTGDICRELARSLAERAGAGVEVRMVLDWYGALSMEAELVDLLEASGVELEFYRPLSWYQVDRFNHRTHRRILVVDGRIGFTGGVGIAREWTGDASGPESFRDTHYRVEGPVVADLQEAFDENWRKAGGEPLSGESYFPPLGTAGGSNCFVVTSSPGTGRERARELYLRAVASARESLRIGTPYFVPDEVMIEQILAATRRGVEVEVLVPGRSTDSDAARYASRRKWGRLIEAGVDFFEYHPEIFYHAKLTIVDDFLVLVGSTNFDSRSFQLNDEINLVVADRDFASEQAKIFAADLGPAKKVSYEEWRSRPLREKLLEPLALLIQGQL